MLNQGMRLEMGGPSGRMEQHQVMAPPIMEEGQMPYATDSSVSSKVYSAVSCEGSALSAVKTLRGQGIDTDLSEVGFTRTLKSL